MANQPWAEATDELADRAKDGTPGAPARRVEVKQTESGGASQLEQFTSAAVRGFAAVAAAVGFVGTTGSRA